MRLTPEGARRLGVTPTGDGWTEARVPIESVDHAHREFLRLGADVEVMAPAELRNRIAETARTLATRYEGCPLERGFCRPGHQPLAPDTRTRVQYHPMGLFTSSSPEEGGVPDRAKTAAGENPAPAVGAMPGPHLDE